MRRLWVLRLLQRGNKCPRGRRRGSRARTTTKVGGAIWSTRVLDQVAPDMKDLDRDNFFEFAYDHFAEPGVWELYPEVTDVLGALHGRFELSVVSNFDGRLRMILEHLGVSKYFRHIFLSSELGADKPDPLIFRLATKLSGFSPNNILHVGDDPERDWQAAAKAGLRVFELDRRKNSLRDLLSLL